MNIQLSVVTPHVVIHNGKAITTSLDVANYFKKEHKNVLAKIESLDCSVEFTSANFSAHVQKINVGNGATRDSKIYEMTKDGFVFLVMGFTGKKAAQFKEAYIAEFNRMEAELAGTQLTDDSINQPITVKIPRTGRWLVAYSHIDGQVQIVNIDGNNCVDADAFRQLKNDAYYATKVLNGLIERLGITDGSCNKSTFSQPLRLSIK